MTIQAPNHARFEEIAKSYWHQHESPAEHESRVIAASLESGQWFDAATKPQKAAYMAAISPLYGIWTPAANRIRDVAQATFHASTVEASDLCLRAFEDYMRDGEVSPETAELFEGLLFSADAMVA
jgi:hypothetical protein